MLHLSTLDESKPEWNSSGHIVISNIDGNNTVAGTLNIIDNGGQAVLTNVLEHNLVIGLDRNLFETRTNKSDILVIQNPDLKLLQCNSDLKNSVTYALSYVDQERSEILWESSVLKDKIKAEWCSSDKPVFEDKDVLNYDDSVPDSTKNWQDDLEKTNEQMSLDGDLSEIVRNDSSILIQGEEELNKEKKLDLESDSHCVSNYYSGIQNYEPISDQHNVVKSTANPVFNKSSDEIINSKLMGSNISKLVKSVEFDTPPSETQEIIPGDEIDYDESLTSKNTNEVELNKKFEEPVRQIKSHANLESVQSISTSLPEKSLPLKKKAKMKRTMVLPGLEYTKTKLENPTAAQFENLKYEDEGKSKTLVGKTQQHFSSCSDSDEPLIIKVGKKKKLKLKIRFKQENKRNEQKNSQVQLDNDTKPNKLNARIDKSQQSDGEISKSKNLKILQIDERKIKTIFDLVDELKKCQLINAPVWQILYSGLKEMNVDILKEMKCKRNEDLSATEGICYSTQLKAFALMLYFKQPAAFNYLAKVYSYGWPSLTTIKDWKRRINSYPRPNFKRVVRESEVETLDKITETH